MEILVAIVITMISAVILKRLLERRHKSNNKLPVANPSQNRTKLEKHSKEFTKEVLQVENNIYVAIGYGLANCIMIEGDDGVVIIDTLESCEVAREVLAEFRKITEKPIVGIVLTHFHADHAYGTREFIQGREEAVEIYAHESFATYYSQVMNVRSAITYKRAVRQFGMDLPPEDLYSGGIGIHVKLDGSSTLSYIYPTKTFSTSLHVKLGGIDLQLIHAPGETEDQIIVWYPEKRILFPADNIYKAFPNLYAIRGTMHRDTLQWAAAIDTMIDLAPSILIPQHTRPIFGKEEILETCLAYRDAILYVHDQTVRYMNKGLTGREIAEIVKLPPHLANHPYLIEYYGTVEWSVNAVYHGYMGWFSGRPADLHPLPVREEARLTLQLAGGPARTLEEAKLAVADGNGQWALQLTDVILDSKACTKEEEREAKEIRACVLASLADREVSAPGRNWYLTERQVTQGHEIKPSSRARAQRIHAGSMRHLMSMLTCMLNAKACEDVMQTVAFHFQDTGESIFMEIRRGVCRLTGPAATTDIEVKTTDPVWRSIMAKEKTAVLAAMKGDIKVNPGIASLATFFSYFDLEA